jgi:hypothetical protein
MKTKLFVLAMAMAGVMAAQQVKLPAALDKLASKAKEVTNVTLGPELMGMATKFMDSNKPDQAEAKKIAGKLRGVYIRSYEFEKPGEYTEADYAEIRDQLKAPEWTNIISTRSSKEISEIYMHKDGGMLILSAEPKELTVVNIVGKITAEDLGGLSGQFGVPNISSTHGKVKDKSEKDKAKKEEEE